MINKALISVIVPVYKVEQYLNRCVESIVNQTYQNLEIILVDDGSPDNCPKVCDEWAEKDSRIKVIHKENDGLANARNSGIKICTGDYVMFVDSDDWIETDMVEFLYNLSVENNADVSRCGFYYNYEDADRQDICESDTSLKRPSRNELIKELACGSHVSGVAWNKLYTAEILKCIPFDKADGCSEDIMHNYRVFCCYNNVVISDFPKYHYLIRENSITKSEFSLGAFDIIRAKRIILDGEADNPDVYPYAVKGFIISAFIVLSGCIRNNAFNCEYNDLRKNVLSYKSIIMFSRLFELKLKFKFLLFWICPLLYKIFIKIKGK